MESKNRLIWTTLQNRFEDFEKIWQLPEVKVGGEG